MSPQEHAASADATPDFAVASVRRGRLSLRTLIMLRWMGVIGQTTAVLFIAFVLRFEIALGWCLATIAASAWLNVMFSLTPVKRAAAQTQAAAAQLAFDVVQLTVLLGLTGGLQNPFCLLLIGPATVAAATLSTRQATAVALCAFFAVSLLAVVSLPLPWYPGQALILPELYRTGVWIATVVGIAFTSGYAWRAAAEAGRMELALAATQAVLAREQRLSALGGLAAAAAHELGTPLATIQVVAKELLRNSPPDDPVAEDARLLTQQAERCRDILRSLSQRGDAGDTMHARLGLGELLEEVAGPYRALGPEIRTVVEGPRGDMTPQVRRLPEALHGLSSFVENAADFASAEVVVAARFDDASISVTVRDDGPGFAPEILAVLGEPYVTTRPSAENSPSRHEGMGLGFFIAKTLLEHSGAEIAFGNSRYGGAEVTARWPRARLEAPT